MHDSARVRGVQRIGNLNPQIHQLRRFQRTPVDRVLERRAFQVLHGNKSLAIFMSDVVYRADVGMIERRRRLRLALKTAQSLGIFRYVIGQELERDKTLEASVFGLKHHAHTAASEFLQNAVVRDDLVSHSRSVIPDRSRQPIKARQAPPARDRCPILRTQRRRVNERTEDIRIVGPGHATGWTRINMRAHPAAHTGMKRNRGMDH